MTLLQNQMF